MLRQVPSLLHLGHYFHYFISVTTFDNITSLPFIQLVLVNPLGEVLEKLQKADENGEILRPNNVYLTVGEAVASLSATMKGQCSTTI